MHAPRSVIPLSPPGRADGRYAPWADTEYPLPWSCGLQQGRPALTSGHASPRLTPPPSSPCAPSRSSKIRGLAELGVTWIASRSSKECRSGSPASGRCRLRRCQRGGHGRQPRPPVTGPDGSCLPQAGRGGWRGLGLRLASRCLVQMWCPSVLMVQPDRAPQPPLGRVASRPHPPVRAPIERPLGLRAWAVVAKEDPVREAR